MKGTAGSWIGCFLSKVALPGGGPGGLAALSPCSLGMCEQSSPAAAEGPLRPRAPAHGSRHRGLQSESLQCCVWAWVTPGWGRGRRSWARTKADGSCPGSVAERMPLRGLVFLGSSLSFLLPWQEVAGGSLISQDVRAQNLGEEQLGRRLIRRRMSGRPREGAERESLLGGGKGLKAAMAQKHGWGRILPVRGGSSGPFS